MEIDSANLGQGLSFIGLANGGRILDAMMNTGKICGQLSPSYYSENVWSLKEMMNLIVKFKE